MTIEIRAAVELPARREDIELHTEDGLTLATSPCCASTSGG
jgi:uncharacterized protein